MVGKGFEKTKDGESLLSVFLGPPIRSFDNRRCCIFDKGKKKGGGRGPGIYLKNNIVATRRISGFETVREND